MTIPTTFPASDIHPTALVDPSAELAPGVVVGPYSIIGPNVRVGARTRIAGHVLIERDTSVGEECTIHQGAILGTDPQDLKYMGEPTTLVVGDRTVIREYATLNRGTIASGVTRVGSDCMLMAYTHVAHDCHIGNDTIFGPHATLGGHVEVGDFANVSAGSAVHQFCRVGPHGFIGGYSVVTKDALPFSRTIGSRPARIFGVNTIGLARRGFTSDTIAQLRQAFRYLVQSKLNTTRALTQIEHDETLSAPEVRYLVDFIRASRRGVILRRPLRRAEEHVLDE